MKKTYTLDIKDYDNNSTRITRTAVRGIIKRNGNYLLIHSKYGDYKFPGGGMEPGETLLQTLTREVQEETGYVVKVESVVEAFVVDEIRKHDETSVMEMKSHYFYCEVEEAVVNRNLDEYEEEYDYQVGWFSLEEAIANNEEVKDCEMTPWVKRELMVMKELNNFLGI